MKVLLQPLEIRDLVEKDITTDMSLSQLATTFYALLGNDASAVITSTVPGAYSLDKNNPVFTIDTEKFKPFVNRTYYEIKPEGKKQ